MQLIINPSIWPLCMARMESGLSHEMLNLGQYPGEHPSHLGGMYLSSPQVCTHRLPSQSSALGSSLLALLFLPASDQLSFTLGFSPDPLCPRFLLPLRSYSFNYSPFHYLYLNFNIFFCLPGQVTLYPIKPDLSPCSTLAIQPSLLHP